MNASGALDVRWTEGMALGNSDGESASIEMSMRRACLEMMMSKFGIDSVLVSVPRLSRVLGIAPSTIYAYIKAGKFFIPYRMINESPMVTIDDLIAWYQTRSFDVTPKQIRTPELGMPTLSSLPADSLETQFEQMIEIAGVSQELIKDEDSLESPLFMATNDEVLGDSQDGEPIEFSERRRRDIEVDRIVAQTMASIGPRLMSKRAAGAPR